MTLQRKTVVTRGNGPRRTTTTVTTHPPAARKKRTKPGTGGRTAMSSMVSQSVSAEAQRYDGMAKYLYGFVDPQYPGRGPTRESQPTVLATYEFVQNITVSAWDDTYTPVFGQSVGDNVDTTQAYMLNSDGEIAVLVCPQAHYDEVGLSSEQYVIPPNALTSGVTFDPQMPVNVQGFGASVPTQTYAKMFPLNTNPYLPPTVGVNTSARFAPCSWRCVGLRSVLTVTTPAMTAAGEVLATDNRDYFFNGPESMLLYNGSILDQNQSEALNLTDEPIVAAPSLRKLGAFSNGASYECLWLPTNDQALAYRTVPEAVSWTRSGDVDTGNATPPFAAAVLLAQNLLNSACNIFVLRGLSAGMTFTLQYSMAVEIVVRPGSSIGLFIKSARLASHFVTEWNVLSCMNSGGAQGQGLACVLACAHGQRGIVQAISGVQSPGTVPYRASQQGPTSSTQVVVAKAGGVKSLAAKIGSGALDAAAAGAKMAANNPDLVHRLWNGAKSVFGRARGTATHLLQDASRSGPIVEEVLEGGELLLLL